MPEEPAPNAQYPGYASIKLLLRQRLAPGAMNAQRPKSRRKPFHEIRNRRENAVHSQNFQHQSSPSLSVNPSSIHFFRASYARDVVTRHAERQRCWRPSYDRRTWKTAGNKDVIRNKKRDSDDICLETVQFAGTARQRSDQAENRILRVALGDCHVQVVQALSENIHDVGSKFT